MTESKFIFKWGLSEIELKKGDFSDLSRMMINNRILMNMLINQYDVWCIKNNKPENMAYENIDFMFSHDFGLDLKKFMSY